MAQELVITVRAGTDAGNSRTDDTAGHALVDGHTPTTMGSLWQIAPNVAIKLTLPDPPYVIVRQPADVQGFRMMEELCNGDAGKHQSGQSTASWYGGLVVMFQFLTDPVGTIGGAVADGVKNGSLP
jgi:hypothetical protein